jgi:WD40 repeat protein
MRLERALPAPEFLEYDLFISYRHVPTDSRWAKWLQAALERYRLPRSLRAGETAKSRSLRVFRDKEDLAATPELQATIDEHLRRSRFLLVICSPATPGSTWVDHEISFFHQLGRRERILTLLVGGDPTSSFPLALIPAVGATDSADDRLPARAGKVPLAADVRGRNPWLPSPARRHALLSILAPLLGLPLHTLKQGDSHRRRRRLLVAAAAVLVGLFAFTALLFRLYSANRLARQREEEKDIATYTRELPVAESFILQGQFDEARQVLDDMPEAPRNWEWGYLRARCERDLYTLTDPARRTALVSRHEHLSFDRQGSLGLWDDGSGRLLRQLGTLRGWSAARDQPFYLKEEGAGRARIRVVPVNAGALTEIERQRLRHAIEKVNAYGDPVAEVCVSPDGKLLAARYGEYLSTEERGEPNEHTVYVWEVATGKLITRLDESGRVFDSIDFSPDGRRLLTVSRDHVVRLWEPRSGLVVARLAGHTKRVASATFSPDGAIILTTSDDQTVKIWANRAEQEAITLPDQIAEENQFDSEHVSFPDSKIDVEVEGKVVRLLNYELPKPYVLKEFLGHMGDILHTRFTKDGRTLLTVSLDGTARVWDVASGTSTVIAVGGSEKGGMPLDGHTRELFAAVLLDNSRRLLTAGEDGLLKIWDTESGRCITTIDWIGKERRARAAGRFHQTKIFRLSPDRRFVAVEPLWNSGEPIQVWDLTSGLLVSALQAPGHDFATASFSPDGSRLVTIAKTISEDSSSPVAEKVSIWSIERGEIVATLRLDTKQYIAFGHDPSKSNGESGSTPADSKASLGELGEDEIGDAEFSADGSAVLGRQGDTRFWTWQGLPPELWHLGRVELAARLGAWKEQRLLEYLGTARPTSESR